MFSKEPNKISLSSFNRAAELKDVFDLSEDGIVVFSAQGILKSVNSTFLQMTNFDIGNLLGMTQCEFDIVLVCKANKCDLSGCENPVYYFVAVSTCNNVIGLMDKASPVNFDSKDIVPLVVKRIEKKRVLQGGEAKVIYFRDITEQYKKIASQSAFLSKVAHELRNPITSIQGFSELLLSQDFDLETVKELLAIINVQSEHLVALINQVLEISRLENGIGGDIGFSEQALWPIVEKAISYKPDLHHRYRLIVQQSDSAYYVKGNFDKLCLAVSNVLDNACKFSSLDSEISICIKQKSQQNGETIVGVIIRDQGIGMNSEQISKIFDRFWRVDVSNAKPRMGLGMYVAKVIMDLHQGTIEVKSEAGKGTEVGLWLKCISNSGI